MKTKLLPLLLLCLPSVMRAQDTNFIKQNDVAWTGLGIDENSSMPLGNGDLALNAWTEKSGDIVLLLAKADAWSENGQLLKLGRVRVKLTPNPFAASDAVEQVLKLETGEVLLRSGKNSVRIWVDANHPVARVEIDAQQPVQIEAKAEIWRTAQYHLNPKAVGAAGFFEMGGNPDGLTFEPDTVLKPQGDVIAWRHYNTHSIYPTVFEREHLESLLPKYPDPLLHRCFGVAMKGTGLTSSDDKTLKSPAPMRSTRVDIYALTQQVDDPNAWHAAMTSEISSVEKIAADAARTAHEKWWAEAGFTSAERPTPRRFLRAMRFNVS
jgi:alpha-L-fucosidase 2